MDILHVPLLSDNYAYLLIDKASNVAAVIDPAEPQKVLDAAQAAGAPKLTHVLCTHNHWDHAGGNAQMRELIPSIEVIGGLGDNAAAVTREVTEGDSIQVGHISVSVLSTPCHTAGHVCFFVEHEGRRAVFTGDTLFVGGCGNFNAGTPQMMQAAFEKLRALPGDTEVYVGHEYTIKNLQFACTVEPDNHATAELLRQSIERRRANPPRPTVPSTIQQERDTNPFMRVHTAAVRSWAQQRDGESPALDVETMRRVRAGKSNSRSWYTAAMRAADPDA